VDEEERDAGVQNPKKDHLLPDVDNPGACSPKRSR
jgi:hypothetical protein